MSLLPTCKEGDKQMTIRRLLFIVQNKVIGSTGLKCLCSLFVGLFVVSRQF